MNNKKIKIYIVDYGFGNITSVENAIEYLGYEPVICKSPEDITKAKHLILPGVGSFESGIDSLKKKGWIKPIKKHVENENFLFGICLGMQLMFEKGKNEKNNNDINGLAFFEGVCEKFFSETNIKLQLPHIGFNKVEKVNSPLWNEIPDGEYFYFVHSYRIKNISKSYNVCQTLYGEKFISYIEKKNVFGSQFHPEKSHKNGLKLLKNFCELRWWLRE